MYIYTGLLLAFLMLCNTLSSVLPLAAAKLALVVVPTPTHRGVPQTTPPEQGLQIEPSKPLYKDFYAKTAVVVTPVVSTVLYDHHEFATSLNNTWHTSETPIFSISNQSIPAQGVRLQPTIAATIAYDEFEWPTETQIYTTALNMTTTRVVENTLPFL